VGKKQPLPQRHAEESQCAVYLSDGSPYRPNRSPVEPQHQQKIIVTGTFPNQPNNSELVEVVRDAETPGRLAFLVWQDGAAELCRAIEREGTIFEPANARSNSFPRLSLAQGLAPYGQLRDLIGDLNSTISRFVKLTDQQLQLVTSYILATWFPDCFEATPYLWIVGPFASAKTKLLRLLWCFVRRGLVVGDLRAGSVYKLVDTWNPTVMIDELESANSGAYSDLLRMLRTGSTNSVAVVRNGRAFSPYGFKVIASRQAPADAALMSRAVVINTLPTEEDTLPLDEETADRIASEFQSKLLMFRFETYSAVKNFEVPSSATQGMTPRTKQLARALLAPLPEDPEMTAGVITALRESDEDLRIERRLEDEWLVAETLYAVCHEEHGKGGFVSEILVGGIAAEVNQKLKDQGEDRRLKDRKVGAILKPLGLRTKDLGRHGRGLEFTIALKRLIHQIAQRMGINRRTIATLRGLEVGFGGVPCPLCEEYGLTAGLTFVDVRRLLDRRDVPEDKAG
jgi:hypothetical protein